MSNRKRIKKLEHDAAMMLLAKQNLEHRVTQLECEHKYVKWEESNIAGCCVTYQKECLNCGKILQRYATKREWLDAQYGWDVTDPLTGMSERTRQLAEDYVVCLKKNVMNERKAREILAKHIADNNDLMPEGIAYRFMSWRARRGQPNHDEIVLQGSYAAEKLKAIAWWMENKGGK